MGRQGGGHTPGNWNREGEQVEQETQILHVHVSANGTGCKHAWWDRRKENQEGGVEMSAEAH